MDSLVSTDWLAGEAGASDLRIVDASWHLPDATHPELTRDAAREYAVAHIPGAVFLDLGALVDTSPSMGNAPIDNTLPRVDKFASRMQALGIGDGSRIVIYDESAVKSAARAWFLLKLFGARDVAILDGGLAKWRDEGRALAGGIERQRPRHFTVWQDRTRLRDKPAMLANITSRAEQVVDARGAARFAGTQPEPRAGIAPGHIPGTVNLPYTKLFAADGTYLAPPAIAAAFAAAGVDPARPTIATCGSGITACVLIFALALIGRDAALYDGSWAEWGADPALPKEISTPAGVTVAA